MEETPVAHSGEDADVVAKSAPTPSTEDVGADQFFPLLLASMIHSNVDTIFEVLLFAQLFCLDA